MYLLCTILYHKIVRHKSVLDTLIAKEPSDHFTRKPVSTQKGDAKHFSLPQFPQIFDSIKHFYYLSIFYKNFNINSPILEIRQNTYKRKKKTNTNLVHTETHTRSKIVRTLPSHPHSMPLAFAVRFRNFKTDKSANGEDTRPRCHPISTLLRPQGWEKKINACILWVVRVTDLSPWRRPGDAATGARTTL